MPVKGKRVAILVEEDFEDSEFAEPSKALKDAGADVVVVGTGSHDAYRGKRGIVSVKADINADQAHAKDFDAIVVPGGCAPDKMRLHQPMVRFVRDAFHMGKVIAAVCHGPQLLVSADVVRGMTLTCWPSVAVDVRNAGGNYVDEPVVRDRNLITSRKPDDLPAFNNAIIEALGGAKEVSAR